MDQQPRTETSSTTSRGAVATAGAVSPQDLAEVVLYLNRALKVFERANRPFTAAEISARTMLSVLRAEVEARLRQLSPEGISQRLW